MKKYKVYFEGSTEIEAPNKDMAIIKLYDLIMGEKPLPSNLYQFTEVERIIDGTNGKTEVETNA